MLLEDEAFSVQERKVWCRCREEEISQRSRGICLGVNVADVSSEDHVWFEDRWMVASLCDE
jgi:hypothetical protein